MRNPTHISGLLNKKDNIMMRLVQKYFSQNISPTSAVTMK